MRFLQRFPELQELSLSPPPNDFKLPIAPSDLRLDFYYDRSAFWAQSFDRVPLLNLGQYFKLPKLRKLQVEHISFEPEIHVASFPGQEMPSPIEDLCFIDCSPQIVGVLAGMLLSVKCLKQLTLEMNIPRPVVEASSPVRHEGCNRPGGKD